MPTAIFYDGFVPDPGRPVGIDVATEEFVKAFIRHARQDTLAAVTNDERAFQRFRETARAEGAATDRCRAISPSDADGLAQLGSLFRYEPDIISHLWDRRAVGQRRYSVYGITHTSSTARVMDILGELVTAPTQPWDALICASNSIKSAVETLFESWGGYLSTRFGTPPFIPPLQLPVIPLGIDVARFEAISGEDERHRQRAQLGLAPDDIAVLFVGRLSHYAKANPFPLYMAAEEVAAETGKSIHLVFNGYFPDEETNQAFRRAAAEICKTAKVHFVIEGDESFSTGAWAAADIFCSPVDNIQESFGLTPLEAMACGIPVIVSDWDGYRDTVRHGIDGFTVPTRIPAVGAGVDLAERHRTGVDGYGDYVGAAAQATAVDLGSLANALRELVQSAELRKKMGAAGRVRAAESFDWPHIIQAYESLADELDSRRVTDQEYAQLDPRQAPHPLRPDPFALFADFASATYSPEGRIELALADWNEALKRIRLRITSFNAPTLIDLEDLPLIIGNLEATGGCSVTELVASMGGVDPAKLHRTIGWLVKLGICRYRAP